MSGMDQMPRRERFIPGWPTIPLIAAVTAAVIAVVAVYATGAGADNRAPVLAQATPTPAASPATTSPSLPAGPGRNALSTGDMAAFVFKATPEPLAAVRFVDEAAKDLTLDDWKGRVVLLNIWATWCAPCRKEMPQLERLQAELGSAEFEVVALSVDRGGVAASKRFLDQIKVEKLKPYTDASGRAGPALKAIGMPTTLLIDREGREIGRLIGPAEWDGEDAKRLIRAAIASKS
jgi:thiol-disulfide isomerase/thioredoxin